MSDECERIAAQLEALRRSGDYRAWAKMRRLLIYANCCKEEPLVEVMDTDPPCVVLGQPDYGKTVVDDTQRKPWSGVWRGGKGIVWLVAFERMAEDNAKQYVWCRAEILSECPFDDEFPHGGVWSRPDHSDWPVVCAEHGLRPD